MPLATGEWGEEKSAWLIQLSWLTAIGASTALLLGLLILFRVPILRLLNGPVRYTAPLWRLVAVLVAATPARHTFRRYLYTGRHLQTA